MCGIWGYSGKQTVNKEDLQKFKILGLYNESRGVHSCGIFTGDKVIKGVDKEKLFKDFIILNEITPSKTNNILIGHTRQASVGAHTIENCHPFVTEDQILVHNGSLKDYFSLGMKYDLKYKDYGIDSELLAILIKKHGFNVLNEYKGAAALLFTYLTDPNTLYIYHGASRKDKDGTVWEERPLFMLKTSRGCWFSSMENSLKAISTSSKDIIETVSHNIVYKVTNGEIDHSFKFQIDRKDVNIETFKPVIQNWNNSKGYNQWCYENEYEYNPPVNNLNVKKHIPFVSTKNDSQNLLSSSATIKPFFEKISINEYNDNEFIHYYKSRYWFKRQLAHGLLYINKIGKVFDNKTHSSNPRMFFRGVLLNENSKFSKMEELFNTVEKGNSNIHSSLILSKYSRYPVTNLSTESNFLHEDYHSKWALDGKTDISKGFTPIYTNKIYTLKKGILTSVRNQSKDELQEEFLFDKKIKENTENTIKKSVIDELFPEYAKGVSNSNLLDEDESNKCLDYTFKTYDEIMSKLTLTEYSILQQYIYDSSLASGIELNAVELEEQTLLMFEECINHSMTLRDWFGVDELNDINEYFESYAGVEDYVFDIDALIEQNLNNKQEEALLIIEDIIDSIISIEDSSKELDLLPEFTGLNGNLSKDLKVIKYKVHNFLENRKLDDQKYVRNVEKIKQIIIQ